jgi:hypothetical protein
VILVLCAFFMVACLIAAIVVATRPKLRRAVLDVTGRSAAPGAPAAASAPGRHPQTLEGVLTRQLVTGEITGPQYRHAMASIAVRDAERHPFEVPPDVDPPQAT